MAEPDESTIGSLLAALDRGDRGALDQLFPLVYDELRTIAHRQRRQWHGEPTLNTTAVVHELYLKLAGQAYVKVESRVHFFALAARAMRQLLSNYVRYRRAKKRGGEVESRTLDEAEILVDQGPMFSPEQEASLEALDVALTRLEQVDPRRGRVVECRFYGGMTVEDTAVALGTSPRTVKRDWAVAQAWLRREMTVGESLTD
jgi:RNA polymerase sigma factor (TIGR02999 family)